MEVVYDPPIPQHRADWIRLHRLLLQGGVWLDLAIVCAEPLDHWWLANDPGEPVDLIWPRDHLDLVLPRRTFSPV